MASFWSSAVEYVFYWSIPFGLIVGESAHRFFRRGRTFIALGLALIALGFFILPFVVSKPETTKMSQVAHPEKSGDTSPKTLKQ